jgi:hypothetical protein
LGSVREFGRVWESLENFERMSESMGEFGRVWESLKNLKIFEGVWNSKGVVIRKQFGRIILETLGAFERVVKESVRLQEVERIRESLNRFSQSFGYLKKVRRA